ncbi:MAG: UDP-4-amino-4,6-dideoxy-N-acetyl-beta-L-altrosamine transaminase [Alphaproteobacteria bacterium]
MFPYGRQSIDDEDVAAVIETLRSDFLTTGPKIEEFEAQLCDKTGAPYAVVCGNGTLALHLSALALNIGDGDAVIVPSLTFLATANAIRYCGGSVVFSDVDPDTGLMRVQDFQEALEHAEKKNMTVKAVYPVHMTGQCANLKEIKNLADQHGIAVVVDGSHSLGAEYYGEPVGKSRDALMMTYSFHPVKTIAMGEGGAITTHDKNLADKMRILRSHGIEKRLDIGPWFYEMKDLGFNYRITDIQCALGISQIKKLDKFVTRRRELASLYDELLKPLFPRIKPPKRENYTVSSWHLYAPRFDFKALRINRADLMNELSKKDIGTQVHYIPVHSQPYYKNLYGDICLPGTEEYYEGTLSLPFYPALKNEDVEYVSNTLKEILL